MQAKKQKIIRVSPENRKNLISMYGCSEATVYNALAYKTHSAIAAAIRNDALHTFNGVETHKVVFN